VEVNVAGVLFSGGITAAYAQLGLYDAEDADSYPQWETGEEPILFGPKGVAVSVQLDAEVSVEVHTARPIRNRHLIGSGAIEIGADGLVVGNEVAGSYEELDFPPGRILVKVYGNSAADQEITSVDFLLTRASEE
jgi:hypothetical protein